MSPSAFSGAHLTSRSSNLSFDHFVLIDKSTTLENMPERRQPCHCPACNGALVAPLTRQLHASRIPPTSIPSFSAWSQQFSTAFTGEHSNSSLDSDNDSVNHSRGSSQHHTEHPRPSKRLRSSTVCLSIRLFGLKVVYTVLYFYYPCIHQFFAREQFLLNLSLKLSIHLSMLQDDSSHSNDVNISNRNEQSLSSFSDNPPHDDIANDHTLEETSDFDPGDFDEYELQDAALQAESHARTMALRALDQLESDTSLATGSNSDEDLGDITANLSPIENIKFTQEYIEGICTATFENGGLDDDVIHSLRNPCDESISISDPDVRLSLDLFLAVTNALEQTYHACRDAILCRYPDSSILSYYLVKKLVADITGVVAVYDDMCINSCHAFTV